MIAVAFTTDDLEEILNAGVAAVDSESVIRQIVAQVRAWHSESPDNWRRTRGLVKRKYSRHGGAMRDRNGYELNTASTIAALLYGGGDLTETLRIAFNFGWDCDNNAATAATVIGVIQGRRWIENQGWDIRDVYRNTTRDSMPEDETISTFADRLNAVAETVILNQGGRKMIRAGKAMFVVCTQEPANVRSLAPDAGTVTRRDAQLQQYEMAGFAPNATAGQRARAAYIAIARGAAADLRQQRPEDWRRLVASLNENGRVPRAVSAARHLPAGKALFERAAAAGVQFK
jgi:hypothetical protein